VSVSGVADGLYIWGQKIEISNETNSHKHVAILAGWNPNGTLETPAQSAETPTHLVPHVPCLSDPSSPN
jgi:hypothetical protein